MADLSQIIRGSLYKFTYPIFGAYFNTAMLVIFGAVFASLLYLIPKPYKKIAIFLASLSFIILSSPLTNLIVFFLTIIVLFVCSNYKFRLRSIIFWVTEIFLILSTVIIYRVSGVLSAFFSFAAYYTAYRTIQYYVDATQNQTQQVSIFQYLFYILLFPSFSHGPIDRIENLSVGNVERQHILFGLKRILIGTLKFLALLYLFSRIPESAFSFKELYKWVIFTAYIGAIKLYLLFSGDIDIVVGIASLLGIRLSENFPRFPYTRSSLTQFWQNWQTTIVNFLTAYVYFPLCRNKRHIYLKTMLIIMIIGWAHLFYNTNEFPSFGGVLYYTLWGAFLGGTFALSKYLERKASDKKELIKDKYPTIARILYSDSRIIKFFNIWLTFTIIAVGWHSPLYRVLVNI